MRRLALNNSQAIEVGTFRKIFSNPLTTFNKHIGNTSKPSTLIASLPILLTEKRILGNKKRPEIKYWLDV